MTVGSRKCLKKRVVKSFRPCSRRQRVRMVLRVSGAEILACSPKRGGKRAALPTSIDWYKPLLPPLRSVIDATVSSNTIALQATLIELKHEVAHLRDSLYPDSHEAHSQSDTLSPRRKNSAFSTSDFMAMAAEREREPSESGSVVSSNSNKSSNTSTPVAKTAVQKKLSQRRISSSSIPSNGTLRSELRKSHTYTCGTPSHAQKFNLRRRKSGSAEPVSPTTRVSMLDFEAHTDMQGASVETNGAAKSGTLSPETPNSPRQSLSPSKRSLHRGASGAETANPRSVGGRLFSLQFTSPIIPDSKKDDPPQPSTPTSPTRKLKENGAVNILDDPSFGGKNAALNSVDIVSQIPRYMQRPDAPFRATWDTCAGAILMWQVISIPFDIAFINAKPGGSWWIMDFFIDLFWIADIGVQCITGYFENGVLNMQPRKVVKHYLRTWFGVDMVALLPTLVNWTLTIWRGGEDAALEGMTLFRALKATKILKLLRVLKVMDFLVKVEMRLDSRMITTMLGIIRLIATPILFSHYVACCLWAVGRSNVENGADSWIRTAFPGAENPHVDYGPMEQYSSALYFAITITSTVGFGDITAPTMGERAWVMSVMMFASAMVGVVVSGISTIFQKANKLKSAKREKLTQATRFLNYHGVALTLQARVKQYLEMALDNEDRMQNQKSVLKSISSSGSLYSEVNLATTGRCLSKHTILNKLPRELLSRLADICQALFRPPGEVLQVPGKSPSRMCYINSGTVALSPCVEKGCTKVTPESLEAMRSAICNTATMERQEGPAMDMLSPGSFLDGYCIFGDFGTPDRMAVTAAFCEIIALSVDDFHNFLKYQKSRLQHVLRAYAAFEWDDVENLRIALNGGLGVEHDCLLNREGPLHEAARRGAVKCVGLLLERKADSKVRDCHGKRPLVYALDQKHKSTVELLAVHDASVRGSLTRASRSIEKDKRRSVRLKKSMASDTNASNEFADLNFSQETKDDLFHQLEQSVDLTSSYSAEASKSILDSIRADLQNGDATMQRDKDGCLVLQNKMVKVSMQAKTRKGELTLIKIDMDIEDDVQVRESMVKLPTKKMSPEVTPLEAAQRLLNLDLQLSLQWQDQYLEFAQEPIVYEEVSEQLEGPEPVSLSTLRYTSLVHEVRVRVIDPEHCDFLGLPQGITFTRVEMEGDFEKERRHVWSWVESHEMDLISSDGDGSSSCSTKRGSTKQSNTIPINEMQGQLLTDNLQKTVPSTETDDPIWPSGEKAQGPGSNSPEGPRDEKAQVHGSNGSNPRSGIQPLPGNPQPDGNGWRFFPVPARGGCNLD